METNQEEAMASNSSSSNGTAAGEFMPAGVVAKGKRTKRQRIHSPAPLAPAVVADSSSGSSADASGSVTEEDEDMANCLILLAQGRALDAPGPKPDSPVEDSAERFTITGRRLPDQAAAPAANGKAGSYVYECKTCNKCFPSFQALGGHRASHKKPKFAAAEERKPPPVHEDMLQISMASFAKPVAGGGGGGGGGGVKPKVHECSICGSEFNSGQALGGHMRRHRPVPAPEAQEPTAKKERSLLSLDLNLPAPSEDVDRSELKRPVLPPPPPPPAAAAAAFPFPSKRPLIFSPSASLVDCHY